MLDYGCGVRSYEPLFRDKFNSYVGVDLSGNPQADFDLDAAGRIPLEGGRFSLVLSTQVLEHVEDPALYLAEARRMLSDGGLLLLTTHGLYRYHPSPHNYWRWTSQGLHRQIETAGFEILSMQSILCLQTTAIHLWQLATMDYLPAGLRHAYVWVIQGIIALLEGIRRGGLSPDATVYVVLARKSSNMHDEPAAACSVITRDIPPKMIVGEKPTKVFNTDAHWEPKE